MYWTTCSGGIELNITKKQAAIGSHQGPCDDDIEYLMSEPTIKRQLKKLDAELLAEELSEYGAWDAEELSDRKENLSRILWIACGDIVEGNI